jgi:hypothetical protein
MSASVARSEKILNGIAAKTGLTVPAVEWLKTTLDPFHDTPLNCTGIPDSQTGNSVVQTIKSSVTIGCPAGITTGTWDAHVVMFPFFADSASLLSFMRGQKVGGNVVQLDTTVIPYRGVSPVTIVAYPTGDATAYSNPVGAGSISDSSHVTTNLALNANYTLGDYRIVAQAFEVINTTSDLNVQGLCTCYRTPVPTFETASCYNEVYGNGAGAASGPINCCDNLNIDFFPTSPALALQLPNTKQWKAKEGCYVVGHLNCCEQPVSNQNTIQPAFGYISGTTVFKPTPAIYASNSTPPIQVLEYRNIQWAPMDLSGSFFTGLSLGTTLTINWNVSIERFPSVAQTDLVVLAKTSPAYCPMAFELYQAIAQSLPVGVPQKENGLGDWFRDAVATVSDLVTPVMSMIPHPYAQAGAALSRGIGGMVRKESNSPYTPAGEPPKQVRQEIKAEAKKEVKEIKKEIVKEYNCNTITSIKKLIARENIFTHLWEYPLVKVIDMEDALHK